MWRHADVAGGDEIKAYHEMSHDTMPPASRREDNFEGSRFLRCVPSILEKSMKMPLILYRQQSRIARGSMRVVGGDFGISDLRYEGISIPRRGDRSGVGHSLTPGPKRATSFRYHD